MLYFNAIFWAFSLWKLWFTSNVRVDVDNTDWKWAKRGWRPGTEFSTTKPEMVSRHLGQFQVPRFYHLPWRPLQTALRCTCSWWVPCQWWSLGSTPRCGRGKGEEQSQNHHSVPRYHPIIFSLVLLPISNKDPISSVSAPDICRFKTMKSTH